MVRKFLGSRLAAISFYTLLSLLFFLGSQGSAQFKVTVDLDSEHQTMDGTGGNAYVWITDPNKWSPQVVDKIINELTVTHVRLRSYTKNWEPANDNGDPKDITWGAFKDEGLVHNDFLLLEKLSKAGIHCILGIWDMPNWMVSNPEAGQNRLIPSHMYPEFAELVVTYILYARQNYGADITSLSLQNEPNIGIYIKLTPVELADLAEVLLEYLDLYGLSDVMLHLGDVNNPADGIKYYQPSLDRPTIFGRTAAVSYHTWHNMTTSHLNALRDFTKGVGIKSWATEVGTSPLNSNTYAWAIGSMKHHHFAMKYVDSSMSFQWPLAGAESSLAQAATPYPIFHAMKHYHHHITPGSVRVDTGGEPTSSFLTTALVDKENKRLSIISLDTDSYSQNITYTLKGERMGFWPMEVFETTASRNYEHLGTVPYKPDGTFDYFVEAESFHTFVCDYNSLPEISIGVEPSAGYPGYLDYTITLNDNDGIMKDYKGNGIAGLAFYQGTVEVLTILINDPFPPEFFSASIDGEGNRLTVKLEGIPASLDLTMYCGGVDKDGGSALLYLDV